MKSEIAKIVVRGIAVLCALVTVIATWESCKSNSYAANELEKADAVQYACAGAAEAFEVDITPSQREIEEMAASNAWKEAGAVVMANVTNSVNVRAEANGESTIVGKLYSDCGGYIVEYTDEWTKIESGNCLGWVCNEYLLFGDEALAKADEVGCNKATVTADTLKVRREANTDSEVLGLVATGDVFDVIETSGEWVIIEFEGTEGYILSEYVSVEFKLDAGETLEEIAAREAAERAAKQEEERYQYYGVYAAEASDVVLLGALIQCEAGNQPYEGQVAVGAVVMNRVRSGAYPDTIYGVIYASGQFTPAGSGAVDRRISNGVSDSCLAAAQEALDGYSNVGDATHFRPAGKHEGLVIGGHVFW